MAFVLVFLSLIFFRLLLMIHEQHLGALIKTAHDITTGYAPWRVYQSRVLGPFTAKALAATSGLDYPNSYLLLMLALVLALVLLSFALFRSLWSSTSWALAGTLSMLGFMLAVQHPVYLYLWDLIDPIVFLLLGYGVLRRRGDIYFVLLFLPAVLNKESAMFVALWLLLDGLLEPAPDRFSGLRLRLRSPRRIALGLLLLAGGAGLAEWLRSELWVPPPPVELLTAKAMPGAGAYFHFKLLRNAQVFIRLITHPDYVMNFAVPTFLLLFVPWFAVHHWRRLQGPARVLLLVTLLFYLSLVVFGAMFETRIYMPLAPLLTIMAFDVRRRSPLRIH